METVQIGIDENGLGPQLGPLVVTGATVRIETSRCADREAFVRACRAAGIDDSKRTSSHGAMAETEALVLAWLAQLGASAPTTFDELVTRHALDGLVELRRACPPGDVPAACFDDPIALPAFGPGPGEAHVRAANTLAECGVVLERVCFAVVCAARINEARALGISRFDLDLTTMLRLIPRLTTGNEADTNVCCGRVGGRKRYGDALTALAPLIGVHEETPSRSSYRVPGTGTVSFVVDADASEPAVGLASMVGKYVRELAMLRLNRHYAAHVSGLTAASGYHDPVTNRFVAATEIVRRERDVPDACFLR